MAHEARPETFDYSHELSTMKAELAALRSDMGKLLNTVVDMTKHGAGDVKSKAKEGVDAGLEQLTEAYESMCAQGGKACAKVTDTVEEHPMASVLVAVGAGLLIGHLLKRNDD